MHSNAPTKHSHRDAPGPDATPPQSLVNLLAVSCRQLYQEGIELCVTAFRHRQRFIATAVVLIALIVGIVMVWDVSLLKQIRVSRGSIHFTEIDGWARWLSYWGDLLGFNVLAFTLLGLTAAVRRSPFFRRVVLATVCGTLLSGLSANALRFGAGRARPSNKVTPGFYGPRLDASYHSFPSAHTATAFGAAVPAMIAVPPVGIPMGIIAGGVAWSRLQNNRHYPSDVLLAFSIACLVGVPLGLAARRLKR